jgi:UDP-GlcNAc:undecaprenyl-phosphate GlcNAc-1-phosphate transferase
MASREFLIIFLTALALGIGATFMARRIALHTEMVDRPGGDKRHLAPVPLLGGIAIYLAFMLSLLGWGDRFYVAQLISILVGASLMSFLGLWDDRRALSPLFKFAGQVIVTAALILTGVQVNLFGAPFLNILATVLWVLYITNAFNLLDNMDGLASGVAAIASAFFLLCAMLNGQYLVGSLSAALLGACLGFLFFNFNPARIFMGDAGSLFIGFLMASVGIKLRFPDNVDWVTWMVPVLVLGLPIFDTALVSISRLRRRVPVWRGGRDHLSHRLAAFGWSTRKVVMVLYLVGTILGAAGTIMSLLSPVPAYMLGIFVLGIALWFAWWVEREALVARPARGQPT